MGKATVRAGGISPQPEKSEREKESGRSETKLRVVKTEPAQAVPALQTGAVVKVSGRKLRVVKAFSSGRALCNNTQFCASAKQAVDKRVLHEVYSAKDEQDGSWHQVSQCLVCGWVNLVK